MIIISISGLSWQKHPRLHRDEGERRKEGIAPLNLFYKYNYNRDYIPQKGYSVIKPNSRIFSFSTVKLSESIREC